MTKIISHPETEKEKTNFEQWYQSVPPWDIGRPQKVFVELEERGQLQGKVLDVGCGTGENALFLAEKGHDVWGIDFSPTAIRKAQEKAQQRSINVHFQTLDALKLTEIEKSFDVIIDCGLFHCFSNEERTLFVQQLYKSLTPNGTYHFLCFSEKETREGGPRRISKEEIENTFFPHWKILSMQEKTFENTLHPGGSQGYLVSLQKV